MQHPLFTGCVIFWQVGLDHFDFYDINTLRAFSIAPLVLGFPPMRTTISAQGNPAKFY
jgi:hypothetical protein